MRRTPLKAFFQVDAEAIAETRQAPNSGLLGGLMSTLVHLSVLVCLAFILRPSERWGMGDIVISATTTDPEPDVEIFSSPTLPDAASEVRTKPAADARPQQAFPAIDEPAFVDLHATLVTAVDGLAPNARLSSSTRRSGESGTKSEFFGVTAYGNQFVYLLDMSTSMLRRSQYGRTRFQVAAEELIRSVSDLNAEQQFCVILFSYRTRLFLDAPQAQMLPATQANKQRLRLWLSGIRLAPGTDPRLGVMAGLRLKPSAIFLLSDGEFNGREDNRNLLPGNPAVEQIVASFGPRYTPIHTIAFEDKRNRKRLRRLSQATGGTHRFVCSDDRHDVLLEDLTSRRPDDAAYALSCIIGEPRAVSPSQRRRFAPVLIRMLAAPTAREQARRALVAISDGQDYGPHDPRASREEVAAAQELWAMYWSDEGLAAADRRSPDA